MQLLSDEALYAYKANAYGRSHVAGAARPKSCAVIYSYMKKSTGCLQNRYMWLLVCPPEIWVVCSASGHSMALYTLGTPLQTCNLLQRLSLGPLNILMHGFMQPLAGQEECMPIVCDSPGRKELSWPHGDGMSQEHTCMCFPWVA